MVGSVESFSDTFNSIINIPTEMQKLWELSNQLSVSGQDQRRDLEDKLIAQIIAVAMKVFGAFTMLFCAYMFLTGPSLVGFFLYGCVFLLGKESVVIGNNLFGLMEEPLKTVGTSAAESSWNFVKKAVAQPMQTAMSSVNAVGGYIQTPELMARDSFLAMVLKGTIIHATGIDKLCL